ncbi:MAG: hypothetical protein RBS34_15415 [Desulfofustis sp.]|jgi:hypothetical protein|nr:hypothetical protein [Desulfofustis sp.]
MTRAIIVLAALAALGALLIEPQPDDEVQPFVITCHDGRAHQYYSAHQLAEGSTAGILLCRQLIGEVHDDP